jgi:hypothetical protein
MLLSSNMLRLTEPRAGTPREEVVIAGRAVLCPPPVHRLKRRARLVSP